MLTITGVETTYPRGYLGKFSSHVQLVLTEVDVL